MAVSPKNAIHLGKMKVGDWQLILHVNHGLEINDEPQIGLSMLYHTETRQYIARSWGRTIGKGTVANYNEMIARCGTFFRKGTPCVGMNPPDEQFPLSCQFAKDCTGIVPHIQGSNVCMECKSANSNPLDGVNDDEKDALDPLCFEIEEHAMKLEYSVDDPLAAFKCERCSEVFHSAPLLIEHLKSCSQSLKVWCPPIKRSKIGSNAVVTKMRKLTDESAKLSSKSTEKILQSEETSTPSNIKPTRNDKSERRPIYGTTECPICHKQISSVFFGIHKMYYHEMGDFKCICKASFETVPDLLAHVEHEHPNGLARLDCPNCRQSVELENYPATFLYHVKECRKIKYMIDVKGKLVRMDRFCVNCRMPFATDEELEAHEASDCVDNCDYCCFKGTGKELTKHKLMAHRAAVMEQKAAMGNQEAALDPQTGNIVCSICGLEFADQLILDAHKASEHPPECHICETCGLKFAFQVQLRSHRSKTHPELSAFMCDVCGIGFESPQLFFKHKKSHQMQKHKCQICGKEYKLVSLFEKHMRSHR